MALSRFVTEAVFARLESLADVLRRELRAVPRTSDREATAERRLKRNLSHCPTYLVPVTSTLSTTPPPPASCAPVWQRWRSRYPQRPGDPGREVARRRGHSWSVETAKAWKPNRRTLIKSILHDVTSDANRVAGSGTVHGRYRQDIRMRPATTGGDAHNAVTWNSAKP